MMVNIEHLEAVVSDVDGTLLLDGATDISKRAIKLIKELCKKNILFVVASGRQYANLQKLFEPIKDDIAYVCENGCMCVYKGKVIYKKELERSLALRIAQDILGRDEYELEVTTENLKYILPKSGDFYNYMVDVGKIQFRLASKLSAIKEPILKVSLYGKEGINDLCYWQEKYGQQCALHLGCKRWIDFTDLQVNKGTGLQQMLNFLGVRAQNCMAFGDYYNDQQMLAMVGCSVAMQSGVKELVRSCHFITDTVENALEEVLDRHAVNG